jgi:type IV pilus assembly protein PilV
MKNKLSGFGLIEVMVSLVILSIGIVGIFQIYQLVAFAADEVAQTYTALFLAESQLERYRTRGADPKCSAIVPTNYAELQQMQQGQGVAQSDPQPTEAHYSLSLTVLKTYFDGNVKQIRVNVTWSDPWGKKHQVTLSTMISRFSEFEA